MQARDGCARTSLKYLESSADHGISGSAKPVRPGPGRLVVALLCAGFLLSGCAALQGHNAVIAKVEAARTAGGASTALEVLDKSVSDHKDMLYNLERAELLREIGRYEDSILSLQQADTVVIEWEDNVRKDSLKFLDNALAAVTSDRFRTYEGQDYEKVMITTLLALNRIATGDWENARVDIKRTHEREDLIAKARAKELEELKDKAKDDGLKPPSVRELGGYPVELLESADVQKLRNGYQNALSHYLSGFVYEALGEPDLAAVGYRRAVELQPGHPVLQESLAGLDKRAGAAMRGQQTQTDVLIVIESGRIPQRKSQPVILPLALRQEKIPINFALPYIATERQRIGINSIRIGTQQFKMAPIVDFDLMARKSLSDEMPSILLRGALRMVIQGALMGKLGQSGQRVAQSYHQQAALQGNASAQTANMAAAGSMTARMPSSGGNAGLIKDILADVIIGMHQQVDDRMWRMLPDRIYIARTRLAPGDYELSLDSRLPPERISVRGRYAVVPVRAYAVENGLRVAVGQAVSKEGVVAVSKPTDQAAPAALGGGTVALPVSPAIPEVKPGTTTRTGKPGATAPVRAGKNTKERSAAAPAAAPASAAP